MMQVHATRNTEKTGISTVQCSILFLDPSNTIDRASTVSGKSMLRREVIITVTYWVNRIMGHGSICTDPWPIWPIDPLPALAVTDIEQVVRMTYDRRRCCRRSCQDIDTSETHTASSRHDIRRQPHNEIPTSSDALPHTHRQYISQPINRLISIRPYRSITLKRQKQ